MNIIKESEVMKKRLREVTNLKNNYKNARHCEAFQPKQSLKMSTLF